MREKDTEGGPVDLVVDGLAAGGRGVARDGRMVWFIPGAFPGDRVLVEAGHRHARYVEGRLVQVLERGTARRIPSCSVQDRCGGCPWMVIDERTQRDWKAGLVRDALERIGGTAVAVEPVIPAPDSLAYRNKIELFLGSDAAGRPIVGFHSSIPGGGLVDVTRCEVQHPSANDLLASVREFIASQTEPVVGEGYRLIFRRSWLTGELLLAVWETGAPFAPAHAMARHLCARHPDLAGVVRIRAQAGRRGGTHTIAVSGKTWLAEKVGDIEVRLPASCFLQVNPRVAPILLSLVRRFAGDVADRSVADLYGGVGLFGMDLARAGALVSISETNCEAVACGRQAVRSQALDNVEFVESTVEGFLNSRIRGGGRFDVVVANPPRSGMGKTVPRLIAECSPSRVILVSCDPPTLARDVRRLIEAGYHPERAAPVDMFPQTPHVETVLALGKGPPTSS